MKILLVNIVDEQKEKKIKDFLSALNDVSFEELDEKVYSDLSEDQVQVLNDRIEMYEKNPSQVISFDKFKQNLKSKYGL